MTLLAALGVVAALAAIVVVVMSLGRRSAAAAPTAPPPTAAEVDELPSLVVADDREAETEDSSVKPRLAVDIANFTEEEATRSFPAFTWACGSASDVGRRRRKNEDSILCDATGALFVVADGMGGEVGGEVASALTVEAFADAFCGDRPPEPDGELEVVCSEPMPDRARRLVDAVGFANSRIHERVKKQPGLRGMGSTVVALWLAPAKAQAYVVHVGDSRAYRMRGSELTCLTRDHTMGRLLGVDGDVSDRLAFAVGTSKRLDVDASSETPLFGDRYLLCSDGLYKMLSEDTVASHLAKHSDPQIAADALVVAANEAGGDDNVSVLVVDVRRP